MSISGFKKMRSGDLTRVACEPVLAVLFGTGCSLKGTTGCVRGTEVGIPRYPPPPRLRETPTRTPEPALLPISPPRMTVESAEVHHQPPQPSDVAVSDPLALSVILYLFRPTPHTPIRVPVFVFFASTRLISC